MSDLESILKGPAWTRLCPPTVSRKIPGLQNVPKLSIGSPTAEQGLQTALSSGTAWKMIQTLAEPQLGAKPDPKVYKLCGLTQVISPP